MKSKPSPFFVIILLLGAFLAGCTFMPSSGPSLSRVKSSASEKNPKSSYTLISLNKKVLEIICSTNSSSMLSKSEQRLDLCSRSTVMQKLFRLNPPELLGAKVNNDAVMGGDILEITIFDSGGNLFATPIMPNGLAQTGSIPHTLPPQIIDHSGEIMVPYAGRIMARGKMLSQIQEEIETKLKTKIIDPQVVVTMSSRKGGDTVAVLGDVKTPSLVSLSFGGTRLLDAIAQAGGSLGKEYETMITLNRGSTSYFSRLSAIFNNPAKNIPLQFGDTLVVRVRTERFLSFGVNGRLSSVPFNCDHLTLDEALAMVGGPDYNAANPSAILIYRLEPRSLISEMGFLPPQGDSAVVPVIYRLDLTQADGFFMARNFKMRDHDVIYTTDAGSMGVLKFLHLLGGMFTPLTQVGGAAAATAGAAAIAL